MTVYNSSNKLIGNKLKIKIASGSSSVVAFGNNAENCDAPSSYQGLAQMLWQGTRSVVKKLNGCPSQKQGECKQTFNKREKEDGDRHEKFKQSELRTYRSTDTDNRKLI